MEQVEEPTTIRLEPNWEGMARWYAHAFRTNSFERGAKEPVHAFMDIIRYLALTDPEALTRVMKEYE